MNAGIYSEMEEQAAGWVARMDSGRWSHADEEALAAWLARDPRHDGALLRAQAAWAMLEPVDAAIRSRRMNVAFDRRRMLGAGAAAAAGLGGLGFWFSGTTYRTGIGEIRRMPLADGSTATINTASSVRVDFTRSLRRVQIDRGEAWFQVIKDPTRPFLVEAGPVRVQAIGTAFSVRRRDDGADILVTEGVVKAWADGAYAHAARLPEGTQAFVRNDAAVARTADAAAAIDRVLAWRSGKIVLDGERLDEAVAEFNRYNRRKLYLADAALGREAFDGVFRIDDPEGFARMVEVSLQVPVDLATPDEIKIGKQRS